MKKMNAISIVQISLLLMTAVGLKNHVFVIPFLLQKAGRDAWISEIFAAAAILIWSFLILYIHNKTKAVNIFDWIEQNIGKIPRFLFSGVIGLYIVFLAAFTLRETLVWTETTYLPETPKWFTIPIMLILCFYLASTNLHTIAMSNVFVLSAVLVLGFFVAFANFQFKDYSLLRPILEHGFAPVFSGIIYPLSGLTELLLLLFIQHKIHDRIRFKHIAINIGLLVWLTLGPLLGAITEFGPAEAAKQTYPAFEQWEIVSMGRFIEHLDFFSIYQWLSGSFIRISLLLFIALETFRFKRKKNRLFFLAFCCLLICGYLLIPIDNPVYYQMEKEILMPMTFWIFFAVSILLSVLVMIFNKNNKGNPYVQAKE